MHRPIATASALLLLALLALPAQAEEPGAAAVAPRPTRPENLLVETLPNGLEVVIEERHATPIVHVEAFMRIGSLYEGEYLGSGLSHYMEHIVSGGSTRRAVPGPDGGEVWLGRTEEENKRLVKSIGGNTNAATFFDYTKYYITTKSEMTATAVDLIADYLQNCQFDPTEVEREQRVVQQELLRNQDDPNRERNLLFTETMFKVHPVRVPIIGYVDSIDRITRDDMMRFYERHYTPQNCVVAIVGDVDKHAALDLVKRHFGPWKRKALAPYVIPEEPEQSSPRWVEREHGATKTCLVTMGVPSIPLRHPDLYALDMLSNVLGLSASARLPRTFEHDPSRTVHASGLGCGNWTPAFGAGRFAVNFGTDTVENARTLVREVWAEMQRLKTDLVADEEIARSLKVMEKYYYMGRAAVDARAGELAANLAWVHDPLFNDRYLDGLREVTPEQVREAARRYLVDAKLNVVIITPPRAAAAAGASEQAETAGGVHKVVLENGLTLLLQRVPGHGLVEVSAAFNGGVIYEDETTNGLFFLLANTFWRGTTTRTFPAFMGELDRLGMEFTSESHNNVWYVNARALASEAEASLALYADALLHPAIDPTWVERVKSILLGRVLPNLDVNPEEMVQRVLRSTLYTRSPYRRQRFGTPETVASFTTEQVRALYTTFARPNNCVLAVYGDIDVPATEATLRRLFGSWERGPLPPSLAKVEDPGLAAPRTVELVNDQVRTNYRLAWRAFSRQDEAERAPVAVMNAIMGASGWLHARLREGESDYVYAVSCQPYTGDHAGHFFVTTDFSPEDEQAVLKIIDGVVADMQAGRFTDEELDLAKTMILCYDALGKQKLEDIASGDALSELYGQGYDHDERYYAQVRKVTRADVIRVAHAIFERPALRILVRPRAR